MVKGVGELRDVRELLLACYSALHFALDEWVYKTPSNSWYMQMNKQVNYQELSVGEETKSSVLSLLETYAMVR